MEKKLTLKNNLYLPYRCIDVKFQNNYQGIIENFATGFQEMVNAYPLFSDMKPLFGGLYSEFLKPENIIELKNRIKLRGKPIPSLFQIFITDVNFELSTNLNDSLYSIDVLNGTEQDLIQSLIQLNNLEIKDRETLFEALPIHLSKFLKNDEFLKNLDLMQKLSAKDLNILSTTLSKHQTIVKNLKNIF